MSATAILSALAEEQQGLIERLTHPVRVERAGREFWRGELQGRPVVLGLSRLGKVAAATTATALIEAFGVSRVVFTGVAGGMGHGVHVGDVVVASEFVQHDMDASPLFPRYQIPLYGRSLFPCDVTLTAMLLEASKAGVAQGRSRFNQDFGGLGMAVHTGLIASGDRFVSATAESRDLHSALKAGGFVPLAVEMEGAAVAQVCFDYGVPFAAVRTISDRADDDAHLDFARFVSDVASRYALEIIQALMPMLPQPHSARQTAL
ncbi:5'-methylthioadenosine/adenosylhomocysteine nucleosidase [Rhodoferax sp.]|uniref:5'-methylthioadenosine/adenosylhomocysteine nucleosidase n=1 Tax=Rhodoferax sp. TaxID=50421 RepID=UPI001EB75F7A|nr:5'-methylthioadenosine/adenosylhomocysteine nucleosidase [Rhodoferax sp.]MBT9506374.1 5'-methylthioadenosine/adenosylhomocysteine nucleosidase [Rhodoferax sp.]